MPTFELKQRTIGFIGWSLVIQGIVFAVIRCDADARGLACVMVCISRVLLGAEFAVQETLLMRLVPDNLRGRVSTTDRAAEMLIWSLINGCGRLVASLDHAADVDDHLGFAFGYSGDCLAGIVHYTQSSITKETYSATDYTDCHGLILICVHP